MPADLSHVLTELQARVAKARGDIARHQRAIDELNDSMREAEITIKTLKSLGITADEPAQMSQVVESLFGPPHGKTVPDMILAVLSEDGIPVEGARPKFVHDRIVARFGYEPPADSVRTTLWRMARDGRLVSEGGLYRQSNTWD